MRGNTVSVKGNLTRDCEVRRTQGGSNAVSWGVCWNSSRKDGQGGWEDVPHFFDVECWMSDKQLGYLQGRLVKGAKCAVVDGHLEYQSWQDEQGNKRSRVVVRCDDPINGLIVTPPRQAQGAPQGVPQPSYGPQGGYQAQQVAQAQQRAAEGVQQMLMMDEQYRQMQQGAQPTPQPAPQAVSLSVYDDDIPF